VHQFKTNQCGLRRLERFKAQPRTRHTFDSPMILFTR
jgi:hypothetical protein